MSGLHNLYSLSLSHNSIQHLHPDWLHHCPQLVRLQLDNNKIISMSPTMFSISRHLAVLDFTENSLTSLPPVKGDFEKLFESPCVFTSIFTRWKMSKKKFVLEYPGLIVYFRLNFSSKQSQSIRIWSCLNFTSGHCSRLQILIFHPNFLGSNNRMTFKT